MARVAIPGPGVQTRGRAAGWRSGAVRFAEDGLGVRQEAGPGKRCAASFALQPERRPPEFQGIWLHANPRRTRAGSVTFYDIINSYFRFTKALLRFRTSTRLPGWDDAEFESRHRALARAEARRREPGRVADEFARLFRSLGKGATAR
jgi:hypothetical protein